MTPHGSRRGLIVGIAAVLGALLLSGTALGHGGALRASRDALSIPTWLFLATGGGVVGASFLLASFVTDRAFVRSIDGWRRGLPEGWLAVARTAGRVTGVVGLAAVVLAGALGPARPLANPAVLIVWIGWWAGTVTTAYLVGNPWPTLNPFRTIAATIARLSGDIRRPDRETFLDRAGGWLGVAGLLALVFVEVVGPLATDPRLLAAVVLAYGGFTVAGALAVGVDLWFRRVDPIARAFAWYGRVAPVQRTADGLYLRLPGSALSETAVDAADEVAFVVGVVWVTTYDGLVTTPAWAGLADLLVDRGIPPLAVYLLALVVGYGCFLGAYRLAARLARSSAETYLTTDALARRFAPPVVAIAAGYHLAHFFGYLLSRSITLAGVLASPLDPPAPVAFALPGWFGGLELAFVLVGHLLAIWVAHAIAYDLFPGRLQAVRSQYPFVAVMIGYTAVALWIVAEPSLLPPYLPS